MEKKLEIRKIDTKVDIIDCLTKPLLEQCFTSLRNTVDYVKRPSGRKQNKKMQQESRRLARTDMPKKQSQRNENAYELKT